MVWMLIYTWFFWQLSEWVWQQFKSLNQRKKRWLQILSTGIFALLSTSPRLEGQIANGELFMMMPMVATMTWLLKLKKRKWWHYWWGGVVAGIGFLFKIPVGFDFVALGLFLFPFQEKSWKNSVRSLLSKDMWLLVGGFLTPMLITFVYYWHQGLMQDFLQGVWLINFGYTSSYSTSSYKFNPLASGLFIRLILLLGFSFVLYLIRKRLNRGLVFVSLWLGWSLFGALLSARPYPHYLQEIVPVVSLWLTTSLVIEQVSSWLVWGLVGLSLIVAEKKIKFWYYPTLSYYQNFIAVLSKQKSPREYLNYFSNSKLNFELAEFLRVRMLSREKLYVWGTDPTLYNLLDKLPTGGKYIVSFHERDFKAYKETMRQLEKNKPDYVVILPKPIDFPELFSWLEAKYVLIKEVDGAKIYTKIK